MDHVERIELDGEVRILSARSNKCQAIVSVMGTRDLSDRVGCERAFCMHYDLYRVADTTVLVRPGDHAPNKRVELIFSKMGGDKLGAKILLGTRDRRQ